MSPLEGYRGPENEDNLSGKQDIPQSFESGKAKVDGKINNVKDESDELKQKINNGDVQLNIKIDETIDTFEEQTGNKLGEQEKNELNKLLLNGSKESSSSKMYVDKVLTYIKKYGNEVTIEDFKEIIGMVSKEGQKLKQEEEKAKQEEEKAKQEEEKTKQKEEEAKQKEEEARIAKEREEYDMNLKDKEGKLKNLKVSISSLKSDDNNYGYIKENILNLIDNPPKDKKEYDEKYEEIIKQLKNDDNALYHISKDLKENDKLNGTNTFNQFRSSLIKMDSSFREKFDLIGSELLPAKQKIVLGVENLGGMNISGNILRIRDDDGSITEAGKDGRKLSLAGSDYKLDSKINNGGALREISSIEEDFKKEMEVINRELDTLIAIMEYVDDAITNNVELSVVKQTIKSQNVNLYNEMNLDSLTSLEQVKNAFVVMIKQKEEEKEKKIKEKKGIIDEIVRQNALSAKEIDEKKKEILKFLHQIKFDLLPKDLTDQILNEFKSNIFGIPGLDLNKDTIDLSNGKFGEGVNETGGDRWKDNLVKFMEKMIYGEIGTKESIFNGKQFKGELGANIDPLIINTALEQNGLKTELGWNINTIRDNLKKENTSK